MTIEQRKISYLWQKAHFVTACGRRRHTMSIMTRAFIVQCETRDVLIAKTGLEEMRCYSRGGPTLLLSHWGSISVHIATTLRLRLPQLLLLSGTGQYPTLFDDHWVLKRTILDVSTPAISRLMGSERVQKGSSVAFTSC